MGLLFGRIVFNKIGLLIPVLMLIFLLNTVPMPVAAETPDLNLQGTDLAPGMIYIGDAHSGELDDIVMLQVTLNTTYSGGVSLNSMTFHRSGSGSDTDSESISLYQDKNLNGKLDHGTDSLLSTAEFGGENVSFSVDFTVTPSSPICLLLALNISEDATSGATIGIALPNEDYIVTDGFPEVEFYFPVCSKNSTILLDSDGDLNPDETDFDDDNDGYLDEWEEFLGKDPLDADDRPKDTDGDGVPDGDKDNSQLWMDTDDDNDGTPDEDDDFPLDPDRQRDYTLVVIFAAVAIVLIIIMFLLRIRSMEPRLTKKRASLESEDEEDFDVEIEDEEDFDEDLEEVLEE